MWLKGWNSSYGLSGEDGLHLESFRTSAISSSWTCCALLDLYVVMLLLDKRWLAIQQRDKRKYWRAYFWHDDDSWSGMNVSVLGLRCCLGISAVSSHVDNLWFDSHIPEVDNWSCGSCLVEFGHVLGYLVRLVTSRQSRQTSSTIYNWT